MLATVFALQPLPGIRVANPDDNQWSAAVALIPVVAIVLAPVGLAVIAFALIVTALNASFHILPERFVCAVS